MGDSKNTISRLLVVAGSGTYPGCIVTGARQAGVGEIVMVALRGMTTRATAALTDRVAWFGIGELRKIFEWAAEQGCSHGIMAGQVTPLALFRTRFDDLARHWLSEVPVKNAHTIFGRLAEEMGRIGLQVLPASCYMDDHLPGVGVLTERGPDERERVDIEFGHQVAHVTCGLDIGQTIVVKEGMILAVEAFEGTDQAIRRGSKLGGAGAVVVKVAKDGHDMRFDIPVVGARTIKVLQRSRVSALAFQASRIIFLDREQVVARANRLGIVIVGIESGLPPAPLRPEQVVG